MATYQDSTANRDTEGDKAFNNGDDAGAQLNGRAVDFLKSLQLAEQQNQQFLAALQRASWQNNHRAYRNQHVSNSKYFQAPYRNRSRMFRPKVRSAVRKTLATTAAAYFANSDVVDVKAEYDSDPVKLASAGVLKEDLNYRLDRTSARAGVPWFLTCMGAALDAQLHAICGSKQYWEYQTCIEEHEVEELHHAQAEDGSLLFDEEGQPVHQKRTRREAREYVVRDRPMIMLIPPEHIMVDPSAPWYDPAQLSPYLCVKYAMTIDDAKAMMRSPDKGGLVRWLNVPDAVYDQAMSDYINKAVRIERAGGVDRYDNRDTASNKNQNIIWMIECFFRIAGADYHFWTIGTRAYASKIQPTRASYPEQYGSRPYTYGYAAIESHNIAPMGPVEQILPLQIEANDIVNLRLDTMKQSLSPIAKVVQGSVFDWKSLQHRGGADTTIIVRKPEDVTFDRLPDATQNSYQEMDRVNNDIDELSGSFAQSSVQANRQLNETVGGMRLLSGAANSLSEFDLRVFNETWAEPTLRQVVRCIQFYEDDETILALCGERAKLFERYGVNSITDRDLETEVSVRVNVGIGAADPFQRLQKFGMGMQSVAQAAMFMDRKPTLKADEFIKEVFGAIGYNDGMRFFTLPPAGKDQQPPPQVMLEMLKMQLEHAKIDAKNMQVQSTAENRMNIAEMNGRLTIIGDIINGMLRSDEQDKNHSQDQWLTFADAIGNMATEVTRGAHMLTAKAMPPPAPQPQPGGGGPPDSGGGMGQ